MANEDENRGVTGSVTFDGLGEVVRGHGAYTVGPAKATEGLKIEAWVDFEAPDGEPWGSFCNGSITPVGDPAHPYYGCLMYLGRAHHNVYIRKIVASGTKYQTSDALGNNYPMWWCTSDTGILHDFHNGRYWQFPAWSWHPNYFTACASVHKGTVKWEWGYVVRIDPSSRTEAHRVTIFEGGCFTPHLWVENHVMGPTRAGGECRIGARAPELRWPVGTNNAPRTVSINGRRTESSGTQLPGGVAVTVVVGPEGRARCRLIQR
jgi:hypothetical protein